ncbi:MAG: undecaprenyldiphospho-muramoylpentapeptide beta-N-acetylglucosaminyltransferase [Bacteroidetes bacterium]|nr:undecaprenyldiphospho-muramoylpentapeptide beta-N-acetylglucosaminyltransferase [Bacteroidota bacterium]MCW5894615.1 undecaprenyldiphospho-muramoylpentapeptide beta-N-acetylglucosaminyltransferase [Bacteroidota bacterium]
MESRTEEDSSGKKKGVRVCFAGGGTGGHLFPAIAIADEIRRRVPDAEITFVGTRRKIEARVVPQRGYNFVPIWISGFRRSLKPGNLLFPAKVAVSVMQSFFLMKKMKPDIVVGTGGYVCGPPVYVATLLGIPTLIQEQNSYPGVTTRRLAHRVDEVHLSFESSKRYLRRQDNVKISGNPTRAALGTISRKAGAEKFGIDPAVTTLLVFGGSLGATSLNNEVARVLPELLRLGIQLIWQTGEGDFERIAPVAESLTQDAKKRVRVLKFIENMEYAYAAADVAACRAGASTLAELTVVGLASVLVPYPFAAANHQEENARAMVDAGAAVMIRDKELKDHFLTTVAGMVTDTAKRKIVSEKAKALGKKEAASTLADAVMRLAKAQHGSTPR